MPPRNQGFPTPLRPADSPLSSARVPPPPPPPVGEPSRFPNIALRAILPPRGHVPGRELALAHPSLARASFRGAGNRTRSTRTRSVRTTGILHPGAPCRIRTYGLSNVNRTL